MAGVVCSALAVWRVAEAVNMERWICSQAWKELCRLCTQPIPCGMLPLNEHNVGTKHRSPKTARFSKPCLCSNCESVRSWIWRSRKFSTKHSSALAPRSGITPCSRLTPTGMARTLSYQDAPPLHSRGRGRGPNFLGQDFANAVCMQPSRAQLAGSLLSCLRHMERATLSDTVPVAYSGRGDAGASKGLADSGRHLHPTYISAHLAANGGQRCFASEACAQFGVESIPAGWKAAS